MRMDEFEQIYRAYFGPVYRYALRLCGDARRAEELTSDTFFKAMQRLDDFRGDSAVVTWLCAIARNAWLSEQRKRKPLPLSDTIRDDRPGPELRAVAAAEAMEARSAIDALPEAMRQVFLLRAEGGAPFKEIGRLCGMSANAACVTYHRARKMLRERMSEHDEDFL